MKYGCHPGKLIENQGFDHENNKQCKKVLQEPEQLANYTQDETCPTL